MDTDFMDRLVAKIDFECGKMLFTDIDRVPHMNSVWSTRHVALTVFPKGEAGRSPNLRKRRRGTLTSSSPY